MIRKADKNKHIDHKKMKRHMKNYIAIIGAFLAICIGASNSFAQKFDGYALYNKTKDNFTYLIDKDGEIAKTWNLDIGCNYAVLLKPNGNLIRGGVYGNNQLSGSAIGGIVQEIDSNGDVVWEFVYSTSEYCSHHDITLIGDNVLLTAWEVKSTAELTQAGYDGANSSKWPTHLVEVQQDGSGGKIVWEWHLWDHLIQDHDSTKDNYGVVADHPELFDINMVAGSSRPGSGDWFHVNGVDYNPDLDQIAFSSRLASEIYIIDHSTTTAEAATHSGGNSGKGGDILYRWGNPANYGAAGDQIISAAVHDVRWIKNGRPNEGYLQVFNNEGASDGGSTIDAIKTPVNGYTYDLTPGKAFEPTSYSWRHDCLDNANGQSASDRMSNGNTFVNLSKSYMYEVDSLGNVVWQYNGGGPQKAFRYECDYPGIMTLLNNPCLLSVDETSIPDLSVYPNPSTGEFTIEGLESTNFQVHVYDPLGKMILEVSNTTNIDLSSFPEGMYILKVTESGTTVSQRLAVIR